MHVRNTDFSPIEMKAPMIPAIRFKNVGKNGWNNSINPSIKKNTKMKMVDAKVPENSQVRYGVSFSADGIQRLQ